VVQGGRGWCTTFCLGKKWYTNPVPPVPPNPVPPVPPPKLNIVIWARSESRAALAGEFKRIPPVLDDMAQVVGTHAPVVDEADERGLQKALAKGGACLVKTKSQGVGLLAAGSSAAHTTAALLVLEKSAKVYWEAELLGGAKPIKRREAWLMHLVYKRKYSQMESKAVHQTLEDFTRKIPADEMAARQAIIKTGLSLLEKNLVQGTWGNISLRLDEQFMLVTPSGLEYDLLTPFDIVRVNLHTQEYEGKLKPTSEKIIHAELLKSKPGVNCVIHSHPVNCSSFAAAHKPVVAPDEASRELLGGDATLAKYALPGSKRLAKNALAALKQSQACIMENHGMLVCGTSLDDALKKCETLERLAGSHIDGLVSEPQGRGN
ncbi:MAG: class II aldolase/adducin family protein, partial [Coriobacteriia bacterium]|nr:class II aldolase/adducin family protein [Coriobacteriia bacterium]